MKGKQRIDVLMTHQQSTIREYTALGQPGGGGKQ